LYYRQSGALKNEVTDLIESKKIYDLLTNGHGSGSEYLMEAEWYFRMGEYDNTAISLHKAVRKSQTAAKQNILICTMFLEMRLAFVRGDSEALFSIWENMISQVAQTNEYQMIQMVEICEIAFYAYLNQPVHISEILNLTTEQGIQLRFFTLPVFNIVYGRTLLNGAGYLKIIGSADQFFAVVAYYPNLLGTIYTYTYLSAANFQISRKEEAIINLNKALELALTDKMYMPFVENCDYIEVLLEALLLQKDANQGIKDILALYQICKSSKEKMIRAYTEKEKPQLTAREMEVAANGETNKEIGQHHKNSAEICLFKTFH
jgi:LuxR family maltose regulon positive regulatory protein